METQDSRENGPLAPHNESVALSVETTMTDLTPAGIRSSPPAMPEKPQNHTPQPTPEDKPTKSDSEAETIVLPGKNGYSPSKIRKTIKHEDHSEEGEIHEEDAEIRDGLAELKQHAALSSNTVSSSLGKRKRPKQGKTRDDQPFTGNSSGLSSVPTSLAVIFRPKTVKNDPDHSRSPSPQSIPRKANSVDRTFSTGKAGDASSGEEGENRKHHRQRSVGGNEASAQRKHENNRTSKSQSNAAERKRKRTSSESPPPRTHRRASSAQTTSNAAAVNGLSHKKRRVPAPLLATRERQQSEYHSDESSAGGSPHPRSSRLRKLATPATGESSLSATLPSGKMPKNRRDGIGRTALARACANGDCTTAKELLDASHEDLNLADNAGNTPLQIVCLEGRADIVRLLIEHGCDIHCVNVDKDTPLLDAVENGHLEVVKLLLDAGVNPRRGNVKGEEPLDRLPEDIDDFEEIKEALTVARSKYTENRRPSEELSTHDNDDGSSRATNSPRHSPPMQTQDDMTGGGRRRRANGRSTKTRNELLYQELNTKNLRGAAGSGDTELVNRILQVRGQIADTESLVAACRGGHEDVIQLLLAIGGANADPPPLTSRSGILPESATPMLAAIGREKFEVVKLLLDQPNFDPTKKHQGETYFEIAKRRSGPKWREEEALLRDAYNKHAGESRGSSGRPRSPEARRGDSDRNGKRPSDRAEVKMSSPQVSHNDLEVKKKSSSGTMDGGRRDTKKRSPSADTNTKASSLKKSNRLSEATALAPPRPKLDRKKSESDMAHPSSDNDPVKPRRKLISGKDLKGEKQRRESIASSASSQATRDVTESKLADSNKPETARGKSTLGNTPNLVEPDLGMDKILDRGRTRKRGDSRDRLGAIRGQSPSRRTIDNSTPPRAASHDSNRPAEDSGAPPPPPKKPKTESEASSPENKTNSSLAPSEGTRNKHSAIAKERTRQGSVASQGHSKISEGHSEAKKTLSQNRYLATPPSNTHPQNIARPSEKALNLGVATKSQHYSSESTESTKVMGERDAKIKAEREERSRQEAEKVEAERKRKETEKAEAEERARLEAKLRMEEQLKQEDEEREKRARERQQELEAKLQYEAKIKQEESERRERQAREDAEAKHRAEEENRRIYLEQEQKKREEEKRKRAARDAEARAEHARREEERRAKLPQLIQSFETYPAPQIPEFASHFKEILGFRYDTLVCDATGEKAKELWILNTQVALLLGLKDLQLSRYTAWDRTPVPAQAKKVIYNLEGERYACTEPPLRYLHPEKVKNGQRALDLRNAGIPLFNNMDLFFVKLSDFLFVVPNFPHLREVKMSVHYKECPKEDGSKWSKWKEEPGAGVFMPRWTDYMNGEVLNAYAPTVAQGSRTPIPRPPPKAPLDPENRLRRLEPNDPQYRAACRDQELWHLLSEEERPASMSNRNGGNGRPFTSNGNGPTMNGFTPSPSVPSEPGKSQQQSTEDPPGSPMLNLGRPPRELGREQTEDFFSYGGGV